MGELAEQVRAMNFEPGKYYLIEVKTWAVSQNTVNKLLDEFKRQNIYIGVIYTNGTDFGVQGVEAISNPTRVDR